MGLTPKQKAFADEYLKCGNATEAAKKQDIVNNQRDKWELKTCQNRLYLNIYRNAKNKLTMNESQALQKFSSSIPQS